MSILGPQTETYPRVNHVVRQALSHVDLVEYHGERMYVTGYAVRDHQKHAQVEQQKEALSSNRDNGIRWHRHTSLL